MSLSEKDNENEKYIRRLKYIFNLKILNGSFKTIVLYGTKSDVSCICYASEQRQLKCERWKKRNHSNCFALSKAQKYGKIESAMKVCTNQEYVSKFRYRKKSTQ